MKTYLQPIFYAILIFPLFAILFTLPYIVFEYRKFGSISILRTAIVYSFILYLITMYFLVILPLPSIQEVANLKTPMMQLKPFAFIEDIITKTSFTITNPSTYIKALLEPSVTNVLLNILMFIPLGVYLRYYFKWNTKKTIILSFFMSLFFECTQLSGLYGIYPRPYRLFDIDDLIVNTLGGYVGYVVTPYICFFLPSKETIDEKSYQKGTNVTLSRRMVATCIDFIIIGMMYIFLKPIIGIYSLFLLSGYFITSMILLKGQTIGKKIVRIAIRTQEDNIPTILQYIIRYLNLYLVIIPTPILVLILLQNITSSILNWFICFTNIF